MTLKIVFWVLLALLAYSYAGYTLLLLAVSFAGRVFCRKKEPETEFSPPITIIIPAYNEAYNVKSKMENCRRIIYPVEKIEIIWVTDGSDDGTLSLLKEYENIRILHDNYRKGKSEAVNRAVTEASSNFIVLTDANAMLNPGSIEALIKPFADIQTGCTAGEKRIASSDAVSTAAAGEGIYWRYESFVKKLESLTGSVPGAAGELFAFRKNLFNPLPPDTLLDDFTISMNIASAGYRVRYIPEAYSVELSSSSVSEEFKRKKRIAAGGIQFLMRHPGLLNPFRHGSLSLKYLSHKVLRWTIVPFAFPVLFILNILIVSLSVDQGWLFHILLILQILFWFTALAGITLKTSLIKKKYVFVPFYMLMMNYAMIKGIINYFRGNYSVKWPKSERQVY